MSKGKILIVEDEADIRTMLVLDFKEEGYEVMQAADGDAAFTLAQDNKPHLIITDVLLPKINGNELIKKLRATDWGQDILLVVLTGRGLMKDYFDAIKVDAFFDKPFVTADLKKKVNELVSSQKKVRDIAEVKLVPKSSGKPDNKEKGKEGEGQRKYCDTCDRYLPLKAENCPHCGNMSIRIVSS